MSRLLSVIVAVMVGLSPLWLGSNRPLVWAIHGVLAGALLVLIAMLLLTGVRRSTDLLPGRLAAPLTLIGLGLLWAVVQIIPAPGFMPLHPAWGVASDSLQLPVSATISINPTETGWAILRWLTAGAVLTGCYCLARDSVNANLIVKTVLMMACLVGLYGLFRLSLSFDKILWFDEPDTGYLTSGFINRNSAATFFGMVSLAGFSLVLTRVRRLIEQTRGLSGRAKTNTWTASLGGWLGVELVVFVLLLVCLMVTGSRGGILFSVTGLLVMLLLYSLRRGGKSAQPVSGAGWALIMVLMGVLVVAVFELAGVRLMSRLVDQGLESDARTQTYTQTLLAIRDYLWLGSGLGTFQDVYPAYRLDIAPGRQVWDKAHNDYLELVLGLGLPAALLVLSGLALLVWRCLRGFYARRRDHQYSAIAVGVSVLVMLHSMVDFSLQMQANTLAYAALLGVGLAQSISTRTRS